MYISIKFSQIQKSILLLTDNERRNYLNYVMSVDQRDVHFYRNWN